MIKQPKRTIDDEVNNIKYRSTSEMFKELISYTPTGLYIDLSLEYCRLRQEKEFNHFRAIGELYKIYMPNQAENITTK